MKKKCPICKSSRTSDIVRKGEAIFSCKKCGYVNIIQFEKKHGR